MIREHDVEKYARKVGEEVPDWSTDGKVMTVYEVPISKLYYNGENGRIATWMSGYIAENPDRPLDSLSREEFNDQIEEFIIKSNSTESFKRTYNDVLKKGQIRPAVVLQDGRVVSGNRRFTVLRRIYADTADDKFSVLKCFIVKIDINDEEGRKRIKTIERLTQFGVDEKQNYDPIDRLVDIYNDLIGDRKIWSVDEYSKKLNLKKSEVKTMYYKALVMADYLLFINRKERFDIARALKLDGPAQELAALREKMSQSEWNEARVVFYMHFTETGDRSREVREAKRLYSLDRARFNQLKEKYFDDIEKHEAGSRTENEQQQNLEDDILGVKEEKLSSKTSVLSDETKNARFQIINQTKMEATRSKRVDELLKAVNTVILYLNDIKFTMKESEARKLDSQVDKLLAKIAIYKRDNSA